MVFSQFVGHLAILRDCLEREGVPYQYLDGATPPDERRRRVAAFQAGEGDCFLTTSCRSARHSGYTHIVKIIFLPYPYRIVCPIFPVMIIFAGLFIYLNPIIYLLQY